MNEQTYIQGERRVWRDLLQLCLRNLDADEKSKTAWVLEREDVIIQLRKLCEEFGDNEWDETMYLSDVIEKHLARQLLFSE